MKLSDIFSKSDDDTAIIWFINEVLEHICKDAEVHYHITHLTAKRSSDVALNLDIEWAEIFKTPVDDLDNKGEKHESER